MFTILMKDVDGRRFDRYFKEWSHAESKMMNEVDDIERTFGCASRSRVDRMNTEEGFYEREETLKTPQGFCFHWALLNGYFIDD